MAGASAGAASVAAGFGACLNAPSAGFLPGLFGAGFAFGSFGDSRGAAGGVG